MEAFLDALLFQEDKQALMVEAGGALCTIDTIRARLTELRDNGRLNAFSANRPPLRLDDEACLRSIAKAFYVYTRDPATDT